VPLLLAALAVIAMIVPAGPPPVTAAFAMPVFLWRASGYALGGWTIEWRRPENDDWSRYFEVMAITPLLSWKGGLVWEFSRKGKTITSPMAPAGSSSGSAQNRGNFCRPND
jgi:hypothetical protein